MSTPSGMARSSAGRGRAGMARLRWIAGPWRPRTTCGLAVSNGGGVHDIVNIYPYTYILMLREPDTDEPQR